MLYVLSKLCHKTSYDGIRNPGGEPRSDRHDDRHGAATRGQVRGPPELATATEGCFRYNSSPKGFSIETRPGVAFPGKFSRAVLQAPENF